MTKYVLLKMDEISIEDFINTNCKIKNLLQLIIS